MLERRALSHGRRGFHVQTSEKRRQIFRLDQLVESVSKSRINKRKIIYERTFALERKELACSFKLAKNLLFFRGLKYLHISNLPWHENQYGE